MSLSVAGEMAVRVARWLETFAAFRVAWAFRLILLSLSCAQAEHLPIKTYTTADGLAHNLVFRIVRDSRGYLWFCTREGLSRFDGYRFTNYTTDQGLPYRPVMDLLETRSRVYWVATGDGLCRFNPNSSRSRNPAESMFVAYQPSKSARSIHVLYEDHTGTVWVGTARGLYRLEDTDGQVKFHFVDMGMPAETFDDPVVESMLYFDVRFRTPGSNIDQEVTNWQQGTSATHTVPGSLQTGTYVVTAVRAHKDSAGHSDPYVAVSASLTVRP